MIFDGNTCLGEALVIFVRFIDNFMAKQCLVHILTLTKCMTGEEIARKLRSMFPLLNMVLPQKEC